MALGLSRLSSSCLGCAPCWPTRQGCERSQPVVKAANEKPPGGPGGFLLLSLTVEPVDQMHQLLAGILQGPADRQICGLRSGLAAWISGHLKADRRGISRRGPSRCRLRRSHSPGSASGGRRRGWSRLSRGWRRRGFGCRRCGRDSAGGASTLGGVAAMSWSRPAAAARQVRQRGRSRRCRCGGGRCGGVLPPSALRRSL